MTDYEYIDAVNSSVALISGLAFDFSSVFFAFIVCVYFVGSRINSVQALALALAYSVFTAFNILGAFQTIRRLSDVALSQGDNELVSRLDVLQFATSMLFVFVWIMSLVYLYTENRPNGEGDGSDA